MKLLLPLPCLVCALFAAAVPAPRSQVFASDVFRDDFNAPNGQLLGTVPDVSGGVWSQTGTSTVNPIQISNGAVALKTTGQDAYRYLASL